MSARRHRRHVPEARGDGPTHAAAPSPEDGLARAIAEQEARVVALRRLRAILRGEKGQDEA